MAARNAMEIFTVLDKSNCRECGEKTCLAFAGAVFTGKKSIHACPRLSAEDKDHLTMHSEVAEVDGSIEMLEKLKGELAGLDFAEAARRCGGEQKNGWLIAKVLGKNFKVDRAGNFSSDIHINPWIMGPFLTYVLYGKGHQPMGKWISYREVKGGRERYGLFQKRCEDDMRKIADSYPDLFADMVEIFQGREVEQQFASDVSVVLLPLPKVPIMVCYWKPEDGLESSLNVFFDVTVNENIGNDAIYSLCAGLATMFEKLAQRHGFKVN
jgi:hypothetical protein